MKCRCPACGRTTWVPEEQLDFVVRCDRCRTLLLTRTQREAEPAAETFPVEVVSLDEVAQALRKIPPESSSLDIAEFMTRRQSKGDRAIVPVKPPTPRSHPSRHSPGLAAWSILLAVALLAIAALTLAALRKTAPAAARAAEVASPATVSAAPVHIPLTSTPRAAKTPAPAPAAPVPAEPESPTPTGTGELFPEVSTK